MLGVTPTSALSFFGNSIGKKIQRPSRDDEDYRSINILLFFLFLLISNIIFVSLPQLFFAGSIAGVTNTIVLTPIERVKCLLQVIIKYIYCSKFIFSRLKKPVN